MPMNLCRACNQDFSSVRTFDDHRVGKHAYLWSPDREDGRRCLGLDEMEALGWSPDKHGRWADLARAARTAQYFKSKSAPVAEPL